MVGQLHFFIWFGFSPWSSDRTWAIVLGVLAAIVSLALVIVSWTRWGQTKSLTKCVVLAVLAHVWLLMYAYGTRVLDPGSGLGSGSGERTIHVEFVQNDSQQEPDSDPPEGAESPAEDKHEVAPKLAPPDLLEIPEPPKPELPLPSAPEPPRPETGPKLADVPPELMETNPPPGERTQNVPLLTSNATPTVVPIEPKIDPVLPSANPLPALPSIPPPDAASRAVVRPQAIRVADQQPLPTTYQNRMDNRAESAARYGGDERTEAAVEGALLWLARNQSPDGHWDAAAHGAGRETRTLGEDRSRAGMKADTGMTGLALLAFQGAGYTHLQGKYAEQVKRGIESLLDEQMPSGDLSGRKQIGGDAGVQFSRMYCHGMATFALAEALAMTGDRRIEDAVQRACQYTLRCQNPRTGGWRYLARDIDDPGDMSQFGWQAMALHSARKGGIPLGQDIDAKFAKFLDLVTAGKKQGLATYRPKIVPGQSPTAPMTAEALACRSLLQIPLSEGAELEARQFLLANLPGQGEENLYYWYYGTLAMFQVQGRDWEVWNNAMKQKLVTTQRSDAGADSGSWDPNCIWAGYGGRVYSTAMSCMCLEVYYRYLPIYRTELTAWR